MKRTHRSAHRTIWIILTVLIAIGFVMALVMRKPQTKKASGPAPVILLAEARA